MATDKRDIVFSNASDAAFRVWVAAVIAQVIATGITQTADTGQVNTGTVTAPVAINTAQGYAVFRFNDTLHGTLPIFFKLEFGSGSVTTMPSMWVTVASGSDGAGTLTGAVYRARAQFNLAAGNTTAWPNYACYNTTYGMFWADWLNGQASGAYFHLVIARGCDPYTGQPGTEAVLTLTANSTASFRLTDTFNGVTETGSHICANPYSYASAEPSQFHDGRQVAIAAATGLDSGRSWVIFPGILSVHQNHVPTNQICYATPLETEIKYVALTNNSSAVGFDPAGSVYTKSLMIWE